MVRKLPPTRSPRPSRKRVRNPALNNGHKVVGFIILSLMSEAEPATEPQNGCDETDTMIKVKKKSR